MECNDKRWISSWVWPNSTTEPVWVGCGGLSAENLANVSWSEILLKLLVFGVENVRVTCRRIGVEPTSCVGPFAGGDGLRSRHYPVHQPVWITKFAYRAIEHQCHHYRAGPVKARKGTCLLLLHPPLVVVPRVFAKSERANDGCCLFLSLVSFFFLSLITFSHCAYSRAVCVRCCGRVRAV